MGRIDRNGSNDMVLERQHIKMMLKNFAEYEPLQGMTSSEKL